MAVIKTIKADGNKVFRLRNIETEEVSIVDRPANLQPFLVVKRDDGGKKDSEGSVKKAGAKMSKDNFAKLNQAIEALLSLQGALKPKLKAEEEKSKGKGKAKKSADADGGGVGVDDGKQAELVKRLGESASKLDELGEKVAKQDETIGTLRERLRDQSSRGDMPGSSQALDVEITKAGGAQTNRVTWPRDLNEPTPKHEF